MKRILISGYHGFGNCGDEAILVAMIKNLKQSYSDLNIIALSKRPEETQRLYGIKSINRFNIFKIFFELLRCNLLISGGGSLLQDVTSTRSIIYYLSIIALAKLMGKPVMIYANGIGPIRKKFNRFLTKLIVSKVNLITLRDEDSKDELIKIGVTNPKTIVTADPVFTLETTQRESKETILNRYGIPNDKPCVGISIRKWKTDSDYKKTIADVVDTIIEKYNCNVLFIPMQMPYDLSIIDSVQGLTKNKTYVIKDKIGIQEYLDIIGSIKVLISMRLHTLIFAAVKQIPMIGLVYDPKIQSFLNMIEQPSAGDIANLDKAKLFELFENVLSSVDEIATKLEKHICELKQKAELNDKKVIELLETH